MQENLKLVLVAVDKSDVPELFSPKPRIKGESSGALLIRFWLLCGALMVTSR